MIAESPPEYRICNIFCSSAGLVELMISLMYALALETLVLTSLQLALVPLDHD